MKFIKMLILLMLLFTPAIAAVKNNISIINLIENQVVLSNNGSLTISVEVSPALKARNTICYYFIVKDRDELITCTKRTTIQVYYVARGMHEIYASIENDDGRIIVDSKTVIFYVLRGRK